MVTLFDDLSGHSYPFTFLMFLNFLLVQFLCKAISYNYVRSYHNNKLLQCPHVDAAVIYVHCVCLVICSE